VVLVKPLSNPPHSLEELFSLPFSPFPFCLGTQTKIPKREYLLARSDSELYAAFRIGGTPVSHPHAQSGEFVEGLWEYDVVELFLLDRATERYEEFNIAPSGAWWRCAFASYRIKDNAINCSVASPVIWRTQDVASWCVALSIPFSMLSIAFGALVGERMSVCAILGTGPKREYYSTASLDAKEPDFHRRERIPIISGTPTAM